ncbi:phage Gp37/Gp68 family protein [Bosea sp. (in: a-proteobacteria)]
MAETAIEWTDRSWNPIVGCSLASPGCTHCYAMAIAARIERMGTAPHYAGLTQHTKAGDVWTGKLASAPEHVLLEPLRRRKPTTYFVNSMGDLFHEDVPDAWIDRVFAVMALAPQHTFQILTKRAARMRAYLTRPAGEGLQDVRNHLAWGVTAQVMNLWAPEWKAEGINGKHRSRGIGAFSVWPLPNVWLGVSAEDQRRTDERVPELLATPAAIRFVSAEPLLGPIDFTTITNSPNITDALTGEHLFGRIEDARKPPGPKLDWIIVGGESGPNARPMHPQWARSIHDQCAASGTAFFFKQWGEWAPSTPEKAYANPRSGWRCLAGHPHLPKREELYPENGAAFIEHMGKKAAGRLLDGIEHNAMPEARS